MTAETTTRAEKMVTFELDGKKVTYPAETTILRAAQAEGIDVPYYCYHPGLTIAGNCRMCLVESSNSRKPVISCQTLVQDGVEIETRSESVQRAREAVLEFMLANHPLDCPVCDKAGECWLQDFSYAHGKSTSRMHYEDKVIRHTKDLGSTIKIWGNRCIVCTRCVRFCDEISGTGELTVVERGDHSVIDVFPGFPLENPLAGNVVDICPVGALISKDFLFQARVWSMKKRRSVCAECARGCNIQIETLENKIKRLTPRENQAVNQWWMCDHGRYTYAYVGDADRTWGYEVGGEPATAGEAAGRIAEELARIRDADGPESIGILASTFQTVEELYLIGKLAEALGGAGVGCLARPSSEDEIFPKFRIAGDKNPNRKGVELVLGRSALEAGLEEVLERLAAGRLRALVLVANLPGASLPPRLADRLPAAKTKIYVFELFRVEGVDPENAVVLPALSFAEREGTFVNEDGRVQRIRTAVVPMQGIETDLKILQDVLCRLGARDKVLSAEGVFREAAGELAPLAGLSYRQLADLGKAVAAPGEEED